MGYFFVNELFCHGLFYGLLFLVTFSHNRHIQKLSIRRFRAWLSELIAAFEYRQINSSYLNKGLYPWQRLTITTRKNSFTQWQYTFQIKQNPVVFHILA